MREGEGERREVGKIKKVSRRGQEGYIWRQEKGAYQYPIACGGRGRRQGEEDRSGRGTQDPDGIQRRETETDL